MSSVDTSAVALTPSDFIGAVKQGLIELQSYLSQPVGEINPAPCVAHLEHMAHLMARLQAMVHEQAKAAPSAEARRN